MTNTNRSYRLLRRLQVSLFVADEVSRLMSNMSVIEQDIIYYWLQNYTKKEIQNLLHTTKYRVETAISKFKALGKAEMCAISG